MFNLSYLLSLSQLLHQISLSLSRSYTISYDISNLGIVFGPTLLRPDTTDWEESAILGRGLYDNSRLVEIVAELIEYYA
eukprot:Awhi_evm1s13839